jgi:hypothetical protein
VGGEAGVVVRPVLLLDVDGVLNPYGGECPDGYAEHLLFPGEEPVRVCRLHGDWVAELAATFEVVWGSAWGAEANRLLGPLLGLPELPYVRFPPMPFEPALKVPAIDRHLRDRPAVWIDDLIGPEAREWASSRAVPTLLIEVDPAVGLTRDDVDRALRWAADHS